MIVLPPVATLIDDNVMAATRSVPTSLRRMTSNLSGITPRANGAPNVFASGSSKGSPHPGIATRWNGSLCLRR